MTRNCTYQVPGKEGLKVPVLPVLYVPPAHLALVQHSAPFPATPLSPDEYKMVVPAIPSFIYLERRSVNHAIIWAEARDRLTYSLHCRFSYAADKSASLEPYDVDMTDAAVYLPQSWLL